MCRDCVGDAVVRRRGGAGAAVRADFAPLDCALVAVACIGLEVWWQYPFFVPQVQLPAEATAAVAVGQANTADRYARVMTANVYKGQADPHAIVDAVRDQRVEVLALQETTDEFVAALNDAGIGTYLPYAQVSSSDGVYGNGLWSVTALADPADDDVHSSASFMPGGTVTLGGCARPLRIRAYDGAGARVLGAVEAVARRVGDAARRRRHPYIFMGDFNATTDHTPFHNFLVIDSGTRSSSPATVRVHLADRPRMAAALRGYRPYCGRSGHVHRPVRGGGDPRLRPRRPAGHRGRLLTP